MRRALVTGGGEGIGRALSAALAAEGLEVVSVELDVTADEDLASLAERAGPVDVLVNCAGVLLDRDADPLTLDPALLRRTLEVNLVGAWRVCQALVPGMVERGYGRVVNVSSGAGSHARGLWTVAHAYSASKAALNAFTVNLAEHLRGTGVLVNAADPGVVRTRMSPHTGRTPEEAAAGMVWLCTLPADGPTAGFFADGEPVGW